MLQTIILLPVELLGIQSVFESLFSFTHNGGTWFISCILICYLLYPAIQELVIRLRNNTKIKILLIVVFILLYAPIVVKYFGLSPIYSNPFFRLMEFFIGIIIASMKEFFDRIELVKKYVYNWKFVSLISVLLISGVTVAVKLNIAVNNYMLYSWISLPCFIALVISLGGVTFEKIGSCFQNGCIYLSKITYCLFLAQLFSNKISKVIINQFNIGSNLMIIFVGWTVCIAITVFLHEVIEKRLKRYFIRLLLE